MRTRRLQVFAVEPDAIQVTWGALGPGEVPVRCGPVELTVEADGGPGAVELTGLAPATAYEIEVGEHRLAARTSTPPPGEELFRLATVSDLHLGLDRFGVFNRMRERPDPEELHTERCTRAALAEAKAWGAEELVIKGDATDRGSHEHYELLGKVLAEAGLRTHALPGNHEVKPYRTVDHQHAFADLGLEPFDGVRVLDVPGLRIALVDSTTTTSRHGGQVDHAADCMDEALEGRPSLVLLHHNLLVLPVSTFWPPGIGSREGDRFIAAVAAASPAAVIASGHTHRHRMRRVGHVTVTETGSPKDYPGTWTGYAVHEGGLRQVVRRVTRADCIAWTERTRRAAMGVWGLWSPGTLDQRCWTVSF